MYTEKFKDREYQQPEYLEAVNLDSIDSRCKYLSHGVSLTTKQMEVEMERATVVKGKIQLSLFGAETAQTCQVSNDKFYYLTTEGVYQIQHLNWLENLLSQNQVADSSSYFNVFTRALNIYTGKLKGLRIEGDSE